MPQRRGFSQTDPAPLAGAPAAREPQNKAAGRPGLANQETPNNLDNLDSLAIAGIIGAELSAPVMRMRLIVQDFLDTQRISRRKMTMLLAAIEQAHRVSVQSQQIARLAEGRLRQSHERLHLDQIVHDALQSRAEAIHDMGAEVYHNIKPIEVIVDPGLLASLVDAAIDWGFELGRRLVITLDMKNWPEHAILLIKTGNHIAAGATRDGPPVEDGLCWNLIRHIADTMGVTLDHAASASEQVLMLEFPRTVRQLEGLTAVEVDGGDMHSESKPLAGHRILLVTTDDRLRIAVKEICRSMALVLDTVPSSLQAVRFCELDMPQLILVDEPFNDHVIRELRSDLHNIDPNFPFVEIASASNTLEIASWMGDSMTRISRDALKSQLPSVLVMELAKVI